VFEDIPQQIGADMKQRAGEQGQQQDAGSHAAQLRRVHRCDLKKNTHYATRENDRDHPGRTTARMK
jgi:hypothetical protein